MSWKALFLVRKYIVDEPLSITYNVFGKEIHYDINSDKEGTKIGITFDSEVSKPPFLQQERAEEMLTMLKEVSAPYIMDAFDTELIEIVPADDESRRQYDSLEWPRHGSLKPKPRTINGPTLGKIKNTFTKIHPGGPIRTQSSIEEVKRSNDLLRFDMVLRWYNRSMELKETLDKFISLWVTFNMLYDYIWNKRPLECGHKKHKKMHDGTREKIKFCVKNSFNDANECKEILEPHRYALTEYMPPYELRASAGFSGELEAVEKSKNIEIIKEFHERTLDLIKKERKIEKKNTMNYDYFYYHGLDFHLYWRVENWIESLVQVLLNIYNLRISVFHTGVMPSENGDPNIYSYWMMVNDVLSKTDALLIQKLLKFLFI